MWCVKQLDNICNKVTKINLHELFVIQNKSYLAVSNLKHSKQKRVTMKNVKEVYLTIEAFDKDLEDCLTILREPTNINKYYVCEYVSPALYKSIIHIYIIK